MSYYNTLYNKHQTTTKGVIIIRAYSVKIETIN